MLRTIKLYGFQLCLLLYFSGILCANAQQTIPLEFKKGILTSISRLPDTIKPTDKLNIQLSEEKVSPDMVKKMEQSFLTKIEAAIDNLENQNLRLDILYDELWGPGWSTKYLDDLKELRAYLQTTNKQGSKYRHKTYDYLPSPYDLDILLDTTKTLFTSKTDSTLDRRTIDILFNEPYPAWIANRYNQHASAQVQNLTMNSGYRNGWRRLEALRDSMLKIHAALITKKGALGECKLDPNMEAAKNLLSLYSAEKNSNGALGLLKSPFYQEWLWYTDGVLTTNPFFFTTPGRTYPDKLKAADTEEIKKAIAENKKNNEAFFKGRYVYNKVELTHTNDNKEIKTLWHLDALNKYDHKNNNTENLVDDDEIFLAIHNTHKDINLNIDIQKINDSTLDPAGALTAGLAEPLRLIATLAPTSTFLKGALGLLIAQSGQSAKPVRGVELMAENKVMGFAMDMRINGYMTEERFAALLNRPQDEDAIVDSVITEDHKAIAIIKDSIYYDITRNPVDDKKNLLEKYALYNDLNNAAITSFLKKDIKNRLNYDTTKLINSVDRLFKAFRVYVREVDKCNEDLKSVLTSLEQTLNILDREVAIVDRSLPPAKIEITEKTDKPIYRTEILSLPMDANKKRKISLIETTKINDTTSKKRIVYKENYKVGEYKFWCVSAGLAYTVNDYNRITISDDNKEIKNDNSRFHGVAGLHFYPWKINNNDDRFMRLGNIKHRTSIYLGLDLTKPLDHHFPGIGFDLVPGLKFIMGAHTATQTRYKLYNSEVVDKAMGLDIVGGYISIGIDPVSFIKLF